MENKTIINELKVDWDTVLTDEFNPLHFALSLNKGHLASSDFRDMYHKLENAMEQIINENFKGFSDSVLSYNQFHKQNKQLLKNLNECSEISVAQEHEYGLKEITEEFAKSEYYGDKYEICRKLLDIKLTFEEYEITTDTLKKCYQLVKCLDLIDNKEYVKIKGVYEYRKMIYKSYLELTDIINLEIFDFIFYNKINNSFKCLLILGSLHELELFVKKYFRSYLFNSIETLILQMYKGRMNLEKLCKQIIRKIDMIIKNYSTVIELTLNNFKLRKTEEDYFGNRNETYIYVTKLENVMDIIKDELGNFINKYSISTEFDNKFSLESIVDTVDYNKIYPEQYNIFKSKLDESNIKKPIINTTSTQYTLITTPKIETTAYLLKYAENTILRIFLNQRVEKEYTKFKMEKNKKKIDYVFESNVKIDPLHKKLTLENEIVEILNNQKVESKNSNYDKQLIKHLSSKIKELYNKQFHELFKSDMVVGTAKRIFMYDGDKGGFINDFDSDFKESIVKKYINKNVLLLKKTQYQKAIYTLNTLKEFDRIVSNRDTANCHEAFYITFKQQINLEFFYYFDLFYREGNFSQSTYLRKIVRIFEMIYNETNNTLLFDGLYENLFYYCRNNINAFNVKTKNDIKEFLEQIRIFDEIMGEVEFYANLQPLYTFFNEIIDEKSTDKKGKILQARIRSSDQ